MSDILILTKPYKRKNRQRNFYHFIVREPNTKNTAEDLILQLLENRIREAGKEVENVD